MSDDRFTPINGHGSLVSMPYLVTLVVIMMRTGWRMSRFEGRVLVLTNLGRWVADLARTSPIGP